MADPSLTDIMSVINQQINVQETLSEQLAKAKAIACVTSIQGFLDFERSIVQDFLWVLIDLLAEAKKLNDEALKSFMINSRILGLR